MGTAVLLTLLTILHVGTAIGLRRLAARLGVPCSPVLAALPVVNLAVPVRLAGYPAWWSLLLLVPGVNLVVWYLAWDKIARRVHAPGAAAAIMLVPFANLAMLARLAGLRGTRLALACGATLLAIPGLTAAARGHRADRVAALVRDLRSNDPRSQVDAARALAWIGRAAGTAAPALSETLATSADPEVRAEAAAALGSLGPLARPAFPAVAGALRDPDARVRANAAHAAITLAHGTPAVAPLDVAVPALLEAARSAGDGRFADAGLADALASFGPPALPFLLEALGHPEAAVRWHAAAALTQMGPAAEPAAPALLATMGDPEWNVRNAAGFALEHVAGPASVSRLAEALTAENVEVRYHVARSLMWLAHGPVAGRPENDAAVPALAIATRDPDSDVRRYSVRALGRPGPRAPEAVPALITALADADLEVRLSAVASLGNLAGQARDAVAALQNARADADRQVRKAAAEALARIGAP